MSEAALLEVSGLHAYYGKSHVLHGVDLEVRPGEIVSLLGRNGAGRSTMIKAVIGDVAPQGSILFRGRQIVGMKPHHIARLGIAYVPESRDVFPTLTVRENLRLGKKSSSHSSQWSIEEFFDWFPSLAPRADTAAGVLSGGEQQMLTIYRSLMGDPALIMIDEPTEGLAPKLVERVRELLEHIVQRGISILLVEQKLTIALRISHRLYVMGHGAIVFEGTPGELKADEGIRKEWLEV